MTKSTRASQRAMGMGMGGNKDQMWFSPEKKKKKKSCTVANGGVRRKKKLNDGCNA